MFADPLPIPMPLVMGAALPTVPPMTTTLLLELDRASAVVPTADDPTTAPASIVTTLLLLPLTNVMPSLLADVIVALPETLIAPLDAASKTTPAKAGSFTDVAVPSPMLTVTPLTAGAVLTRVFPAPVQVIESPDWSAVCEPLPVITQAAAAGAVNQGSVVPAARALIAVLKRSACRGRVVAALTYGEVIQ
ncbi:hypothetical protein [Bradyrhizobium frederickii]|uniref:hypothetical protein n=1 Tax=Bradyrhizobium frederickii TaxID=2560054 RepID=UPI001F2DE4B0|nr:hypothetical protein [Bradyrhizobium frederickii]